MNGNNSQTKEGFIKTLGHPRKQELATMICDGAEVSAMLAAGYGRINIIEMARDIRNSVVGMEGLSIDVPREGHETVGEVPAEVEVATTNAAPTPAPEATVSAPTEPTTESTNEATVTESAETTETNEPVASNEVTTTEETTAPDAPTA